MLFVGYPASGKSTLFRQHFEPEGYIHINQDTLRTRDKCVKAAEEAITQGHSCVIGVVSLLLSIEYFPISVSR